VIFSVLLYLNLRKEKYQITPISFFYLLLLVDVIMPAILFELSGMPRYPQYFGLITREEIIKSLGVFVVAAIFFTIGYRWKVLRIFEFEKKKCDYKLRYKMVYFMYVMVLVVIALNMYFEIKNIGGLDLYYIHRIKRVYLATIEPKSVFEKIIMVLSGKSSDMLILLNGLLFFNRFKYNKKIKWGIISPLITFFIILTRLHRGTILNFFISIIIIEVFRIQNSNFKMPKFATKITRRKLIKISFFAIGMFLVFGTIRGSLNSSVWGYDISLYESFLRQLKNNFGVSLIALARVLKHFKSFDELMYGRTVYEMFYFFFPRSIWVEKPVKYGIISANILMGSPSSTMDAITMPGEMIANFGVWGVAMVSLFGYYYKVFKHYLYNEKYISIYAALLPTITVPFWMSFTGLFSQMVYLPMYLIMIKLAHKKRFVREDHN